MEMIAFIIWLIIGVMEGLIYLIQTPAEREAGGCSWFSYWAAWLCLAGHLIIDAMSV